MSQEVNGHIIREKIPNITLAANTPLGTAAATVDIISHVGVIASAPGLTFTLPAPTDTRSGLDFRVTNAGTNTFTVGSKAISASDYADFSFDSGVWHSEASAQIDLYRDRGMPNTLMTLSGVATYTRDSFLTWTARFLIMAGGNGPGTISTEGHYDIVLPPVGTVIPGLGGASDVTVTAQGIKMLNPANSGWCTLYYILPTARTSVPANFRFVSYSQNILIPDNWVMVATFNFDSKAIKIGTGQILTRGSDTSGFVAPFDAVVNFNQSTPTTPGVVFSPNTPANDTVLYVSSVDGSSWFWSDPNYITQPPSPDWRTTGNAATNQATNFIGTTDNVGLSIRTNNQIRQTITNVGDVGLGITIPLSRLSISGGNNEIGFYQGGLNQGKQAVIKVQSPADGDGHLAFETYQGGFGGGERMRITRNGLVGINTTTPINTLHIGAPKIPNTGGVRLPITSASPAQTGQPVGVDANGDIVRLAATSFDATVDFNQVTPTTPGVVFTPNTPALTTVLYVSTTNGSQWTYNGTAYVSAPVLPAWQTTGNAGTAQATNFIGTTDNVGLSFRTNNQIRQTIDAAGNVGIGTTTPFGKLQIPLGQSDASPAAWNNNHVVFSNNPGANASGLGIGYNTTTNEAWISTLAPNTSWRPLRFHGTSWRFVTTGTIEAFTIAANSNVGINSAAPAQKLEVGGNIRATGVANYASTAAAIADAALLVGTFYTVNIAGVKQLYVK